MVPPPHSYNSTCITNLFRSSGGGALASASRTLPYQSILVDPT